MGKQTKLDFTRRMQTRGGSDVRIYEIFESRYINGAYHEPDDDVWYPVQWDWNGFYSDKKSAVDLINISENQPQYA